jgi:hypothetical protein
MALELPEGQRPIFEPKIVGFLCNWCCYAGADLAGVSRYQYPTICTVQMAFLLEGVI